MIWTLGLTWAIAVAQTPQQAQPAKPQTPVQQAQQDDTYQVGTLKAPPPRVQDPSIPPVVKLPGEDAAPKSPLVNLTADDAARVALKLNPSLGTGVGAIQQARGIATQQQSVLGPQVTIGTGYDKIQGLANYPSGPLQGPYLAPLVGVSEVEAFNAAIQYRQLIYDFNHTLNEVRQDKILAKAAESNLTVQQQNLVVAVKAAFYTYANTERLVGVNMENEANRERQLDLANARFKVGIGLPIDVVNAESSKVQAIVALNSARQSAEQARVNLLNQIGVNPLTPILVGESITEAPLSMKEPKALLERAVRSRPEVMAARLNVSAYSYGVQAARTLNLPSIYVSGAAGIEGQNFPPRESIGALSIGIQWPIEDSGQRSGAIEEANGQLTVAKANLESTLLNVQNDVANAYLALHTSEQNVILAGQEVANAQEGVRIAEGRYTAGLGPFQDVLTAQGLFVGALTDQTNAQNSVDQARVQLKHAIGLIL
ncbi:MAG TPA: TolC family protein [Fimbriimonadaceae bacterium]|jgi:outer membrane protein